MGGVGVGEGGGGAAADAVTWRITVCPLLPRLAFMLVKPLPESVTTRRPVSSFTWTERPSAVSLSTCAEIEPCQSSIVALPSEMALSLTTRPLLSSFPPSSWIVAVIVRSLFSIETELAVIAPGVSAPRDLTAGEETTSPVRASRSEIVPSPALAT